MKNLRVPLLLLLFGSVRCMPDFDALSTEFGAGTAGLGGDGGTSSGTGGKSSAGRGGSNNGGKSGKSGGGSSGQTSGGSAGEAGNADVGGEGGEAGRGGTSSDGGAGQGGDDQGGSSGTGGSSGKGGTGAAGGTGGTGGTGTSGSAGTSGSGGTGGVPSGLCADGCALLYIPASPNFNQFFTINLNLSAGLDLSNIVITARLRVLDFQGSSENIQLYASATGFSFYGGAPAVSLSQLTEPGTLVMDLTSTGSWDNTHVISFGFLLHGPGTPSIVKVLVEEITAAVKDDPLATPIVGPWLFQTEPTVNETTAGVISSTFSDPNVIFANPYQPVADAQAIWVPPGDDIGMAGAGGGP